MNTGIFDSTAKRAGKALEKMSEQISAHKIEFGLDLFHLTYTKAAVARLPGLTKAIVDKSVNEMEANGYSFNKKNSGGTEIYNLTVEQVIDIYKHRGISSWREQQNEAEVIFITNLKGGVSKTVSCVNLAQALRVHPNLLKEDLRILVIDLDPQSSATMFLNHSKSIGSVDYTAAQAMLNDVPYEQLKEDFIQNSIVPNVDVIPSSISDGFLASDWEALCAEHLPNQKPYMVLQENIINKLKGDYDFILVDSGPHLDAFLNNSIASSDVLVTPIPPSQVDLHSTLQYWSRLPIIIKNLANHGVTSLPNKHVCFMTKFTKSVQDQESQSIAKNIFGGEMLDAVIPDLSAFKRCGESFDTVISVNPAAYPGDKKALKNAKEAIEDFAFSLFNHLNYLRNK